MYTCSLPSTGDWHDSAEISIPTVNRQKPFEKEKKNSLNATETEKKRNNSLSRQRPLSCLYLGICLFIVTVGTRTSPCQGPTMIRTAVLQNIDEGTSKDAVGLNAPVTYRTTEFLSAFDCLMYFSKVDNFTFR